MAKSNQSDLSAKAVAAIKAQIDRFVQTVLASQFDDWGKLLAKDVVVMPPNEPAVVGRDAAVAWGKAYPHITSFTVSVDEVAGRGDLAYARGTYMTTATLKDGTSVNGKGSFLDIHRRAADGSWPYTRLMFHSDTPPGK